MRPDVSTVTAATPAQYVAAAAHSPLHLRRGRYGGRKKMGLAVAMTSEGDGR
jgi:hypothetical protein